MEHLAELGSLGDSVLAIFCVATYGKGEPTDNAKAFHDWLKCAHDSKAVSLQGLNYTVSVLDASAALSILSYCIVLWCVTVAWDTALSVVILYCAWVCHSGMPWWDTVTDGRFSGWATRPTSILTTWHGLWTWRFKTWVHKQYIRVEKATAVQGEHFQDRDRLDWLWYMTTVCITILLHCNDHLSLESDFASWKEQMWLAACQAFNFQAGTEETRYDQERWISLCPDSWSQRAEPWFNRRSYSYESLIHFCVTGQYIILTCTCDPSQE